VGAVLGEAFGAIAALQQKRFAFADAGERALERPRLAGKNERREGREQPLDLGKRLLIRIIRHLLDRLRSPAVGGPTRGHGYSPSLQRGRGYTLKKLPDASCRLAAGNGDF